MTFTVHANLDCEATWSGATLPLAVQRRISAIGTLVAALAPGEVAATVWTPVAVDPARLVGPLVPALCAGTPVHADLAWAQPAAKAANDRRLALTVAALANASLPHARAVTSLDELDAHLRVARVATWVCKAPWTAAGRDRWHGIGDTITGEARVRLARMFARFGALVFEPWLDRILDVGVCATVDARGIIGTHAPHGLVVDQRGQFTGIDLAAPALEATEHARLDQLVEAAGVALAAIGYAGPFALDAFAYRDGGERKFHPICEINARYTFGWVARALATRFGARVLGFGAPPAGATLLVAPGVDDPATAWMIA